MMKKMVLMGGAFLFASVALCAEGKAVSYDDSSEVCVKKNGKEALEGFYAGLGLGHVASDSRANVIEHNYEWSGNINYGGAGGGAGAAHHTALMADLLPCGITGDLNSFTTDPAAAMLTSFKIGKAGNRCVSGGKSSKLGGSVIAGYGRFISGETYLGTEFIIDFSGNKENQYMDADISRGFGNAKIKTAGIRPSLAALFGMYVPVIDALMYAKVGACYSKTELKSDYGNISLSKLSPLIGLGVKKSVCKNVSLSCEFDYIFRSDRSGSLTRKVPVTLVANVIPVEVSHQAKVKLGNKGYAIRVSLEYGI